MAYSIVEEKMAPETKRKKEVTVHTDTGLGLQYVQGPTKVLFSNGVAISREQYETWKKNHTLIDHMEKLIDDPEYNNFDFKYAVTSGVLRKHKNKADLVAAVRTEQRRKREVEQVKKAQETEEETKEEAVDTITKLELNTEPPVAVSPLKPELLKKLNRDVARAVVPALTSTKVAEGFSSASMLTVIMLIVGIGSAIMSAYHTTTFLIYGGKPVWTAVITGVMLILFSGTAFTAARYFMKEDKSSAVIGVLFLVAGFAVIAYSMFSTLTVNFNQFKWQSDDEIALAIEDSEALAAHERFLETNQKALDEAAAEADRLTAEAEYWKTKSWARYDQFSTEAANARALRNSLWEERAALEREKPELVEQVEASKETIYTFLARLWGISEDTARFFVYVTPACLYDILAPFALTVVLMLMDSRKKEKEV